MGRRAKSTTKSATKKKVKKMIYEKPVSLKGMHDILPQDQIYWNKIRNSINTMAENFGYQRIDTPILEKADLFERSVGEGTDIVDKEMYTFRTKGKDKVTLRPELTASIVRAYIERGLSRWPKPVRLYSMGPIFRYEKPQAGRYREHHQIDFEVFGRQDPLLDAQLILLVDTILKKIGIKNYQLLVNSIGCPKCRKAYLKQLVNYFKPHKKKLCADCQKRLTKNPLRILDCKQNKCQPFIEGAPQIINSLCGECHDHFKAMLEYLDELELQYVIDPSLVRGLDYYNRTVFEFVPNPTRDGNNASLAGGGRYDGLVRQLGGKRTPAMGFGMGIERLILELKKGHLPKKVKKNLVFLIQLGELGKKKSLKLLSVLQKAGMPVTESFGKDSIKSQLKIANKVGARLALIIGQKEALDGTVIIRDMQTGSQKIVVETKIMEQLKKELRKK
ncbi:MAG: histidine--tRNA ligase [Patescibacteria group bacterium]|nr:histidine--tRNA ligase [Patescibacteria group bacterium]